ncbi:hypothetical protein NAPIS_ORF02702 [Vairimorpha apis BRL 01]|uniref:Reverse transcriptase n=1 Tax=Vairimorpha apis BRL 01 TaxID=1037528 RepID=T0MF57_9MICR|nr:hypothetical protein NAPIS_ORF02702 [Vairimorpha apis BRL 01]
MMSNDNSEIRVDTRISTDIKVNHNKPDIFVLEKKNKEILIVEVGITNQDLLTIVENEKLRKYDLIANELGIIYKSKTKIILYVMTYDGVVTTYHKKYIKELGIQPSLDAYIQSLVLKKTLESISLERRRGHDQGDAGEVEVERTVEKLIVQTINIWKGKQWTLLIITRAKY